MRQTQTDVNINLTVNVLSVTAYPYWVLQNRIPYIQITKSGSLLNLGIKGRRFENVESICFKDASNFHDYSRYT